jgi:hypothetical protein
MIDMAVCAWPADLGLTDMTNDQESQALDPMSYQPATSADRNARNACIASDTCPPPSTMASRPQSYWDDVTEKEKHVWHIVARPRCPGVADENTLNENLGSGPVCTSEGVGHEGDGADLAVWDLDGNGIQDLQPHWSMDWK